jgi:hypothetical protein
MPDNLPLVIQLQFADPWCCYGTDFIGDTVRSEIDLAVDQDAGENAYQAGENGVGCTAFVGICIADLVVSNNDGTFPAHGEGAGVFGNQDCRNFPPGPVITQVPSCAEVVFDAEPPDESEPPTG